MAVKLNLLPADYNLTGPLGQIVKAVRPLNVILLALFLITGLGMGAYFAFSLISLNGLRAENEILKSQIQEMSAAQQQIVLLKDRLTQIKTAQAIPGASENLANISPILNLVAGNSQLSELDVDSRKTNVSIVFKSSSDLSNFLDGVSSNKKYPSVSLNAFNYSPSVGYQVNFNFLGK
jgi:Tfp pilus assembly protein PilN